MAYRRMMTMSWDGLGEEDDDDHDHFFESLDRISSVVSVDLALSGSSDDDDDYEDGRISFVSAISSAPSTIAPSTSYVLEEEDGEESYDLWKSEPVSIKERRTRLLQGMGLSGDKEFLRLASAELTHALSKKMGKFSSSPKKDSSLPSASPSPSPLQTISLVRSRSDGDIETFSIITKQRKEELLGTISKQRLTRTSSWTFSTRICRLNCNSIRILRNGNRNKRSMHRKTRELSTLLSSHRFGAFFLIKNLDTGTEFIVNEFNEEGMWNRLSDLRTGKQLTMEEFEKSVGYSPVVKELMRRENIISRIPNGNINMNERKVTPNNSYFTKSFRFSKRRGVALLKNIKGVANTMSGLITDKEKDHSSSPKKKNSSSEWIKVSQNGKSYKELSALHLCQEIQAHEGSIWTIRFSWDTHYLASAGEDRVIHVWEVQECDVMSSPPERLPLVEAPMPLEKKKKGKVSSGSRKGNSIPEYVHVPETVFSISEKPVCSFTGHLDDVLDLSWSKSQLLLSSSMDKTVRLWDMDTRSCLKLFAHNDYVTCIQFNPIDDRFFISGSLDAKVRIWSIPNRQVVDWTDLHEMVTAACYTPDGQGALIGSHKGSCHLYSTSDCKLSQSGHIELQNKKKSHAKKITGFQFAPGSSSEVLVTSADSRIRIVDGSDISHKFRGFRNTSSQISASFTPDGKYVISASEDSQVYLWKREELRNTTNGKSKGLITTRCHEHFQCRDVSVAIPWPGSIRLEPPPIQVHSRRNSKHSITQPQSLNGSPTREDNNTTASGRKNPNIPPQPKRNNILDRNKTYPEEELSQSLLSDPANGYSDSFSTARSASIRYGDSNSASALGNSSYWSSSWSLFDGGNTHGSHSVQATAWGLVIVTAGLAGEIRVYQNFGLPIRIGRQTNLL